MSMIELAELVVLVIVLLIAVIILIINNVILNKCLDKERELFKQMTEEAEKAIAIGQRLLERNNELEAEIARLKEKE